MTGGRGGGGEWYLWVTNAAILVTNAAVIAAWEPGMGPLVLMAVTTALLALGTAALARAGTTTPPGGGGGPGSPGGPSPLPPAA